MLPVRVTRDEQRITLPLPIIVCPLPDRFWADLSGVGGRVKGEPVRTGGEPIYPRPAWADGEIQRRVIMNATYGTRRFACANTSNAFGCIPINLSGMQTRHGMKLLVIGDHRSNRWTEREREEPPPPPIALFAGGVVVDGYEERTFWKFCVYTSDTCACTFRSVIKQLRFATTRGEIIPPWNWRIAERESGRKDFNITFNRNRSDFNWCNFLNEEYNGSCIVTFFINLLPFWFVSKKFLRATFGNFIEKLAIRMQ